MTPTKKRSEMDRRTFLQVTTVAGGGLMIALYTPEMLAQRGGGPGNAVLPLPSNYITINPDNTSATRAYNGWNETTTDENGHLMDYFKDAYGRIVQVHEHNGAETYVTYYYYSALGSLKRIVVLSSSMVYESTDVYPTPEGAQLTSPPPRSTYGFQKLASEYFAKGALEQYGLMAQTVLSSWGVTKTGDFGEIVFNLIGVGRMRKTPQDRREDFDDVFDFETGLNQSFRITWQE